VRSAVILVTGLVAWAALASGDPAPAARTACPYQAQVFVYGQNGWETLTNALAANATPCAHYFIVLTAIGDKTKPRGRAAVDAIHAKGPNFHALAEFNMGAWAKVKPTSWAAKGALFRKRMAVAGYVVPRDTWAINELSSAVRTKPLSQARARDAMRGLYTGPRGAPLQQGAVFVVGLGQQLVNFGPYKGQLEGWLGNAAWWTTVSPYVGWWGQEAYASCSRICVGGAKVATRSTHLNEFTEHPARLAFAGPAPAVPARALFDRAYFPLMTAYWRDAKGYGNNRISLLQMQALASLEVYAARAWSIRNPYPDGRIGFAWNEHPAGATPAQVQALATRVAQSISFAYGDGGTATRACSPTGSYAWCKATLGGARFNPGWATFAAW
jgi:hypothetical protein